MIPSLVEILKTGTIDELFHKIYSESFDLNSKLDSSGSTALHILAKDQLVSKAYHILRHNRTSITITNIKDDSGRTPLHLAALTGNPRFIQMLIHYGADVSIKDTDGNIPLHLVCKSKNIVALAILLMEFRKLKSMNVLNKRKQAFTDLFSTPLQVKIYNRFNSLHRTRQTLNNKKELQSMIDLAKKELNVLHGLLALNDKEIVTQIQSDDSLLDYKTIPFVLDDEMTTLIHHKRYEVIRFMVYSGISGDFRLLPSLTRIGFCNIEPNVLLKEFEGSGFSLFNIYCTECNQRLIEFVVDQLKGEIINNTEESLAISNIDTLEMLYPTLAKNLKESVPRIYVLKDLNRMDHEDCPICREPNSIGDTWIKLKCMHRFHKDCLYSWIARQLNCPMCRRDVNLPKNQYSSH